MYSRLNELLGGCSISSVTNRHSKFCGCFSFSVSDPFNAPFASVLLVSSRTMFSSSEYLTHAFLLLFLVEVSSQCECGFQNPVARIIGGTKAIPGQYPWIVYVRNMMDENPFTTSFSACTGSLIAPHYVLTAAHCVPKDENPKIVSVFTNQLCGLRNVFHGPKYPAEKIIRHKGFQGKHPEDGDDLAIIKLSEPIEDEPICLPDGERQFGHLIASGWGDMDKGYDLVDSNCLRHVPVDVVNDTDCHKAFPTADLQKIMCAGGETGVCHGDSGGALMSLNETEFRVYQAGIASFVYSDCGVIFKKPSGFIRVSNYAQWIRDNSEGACFK